MPRKVASLLRGMCWLYNFRVMLGCSCWFLVKRMHCVLAGLSLILQRFDQSSISVMHV